MEIIFIILYILIAVFDIFSTEYVLIRGGKECNIWFKDEHWVTWPMLLSVVGIMFGTFLIYFILKNYYYNSILVLIVPVVGYFYVMMKNNFKSLKKAWKKSIIYKRK